MTRLKVSLLIFATDKPIQLKLGLILSGILAGIVDSWYISTDTVVLSTNALLLLLGFSTGTYLVLLTAYRIIQRLFRIGSKLPERIREFDERELVSDVGLYGFVPFGATFQILGALPTEVFNGFGAILIVQGISLFFAAFLSRVIKK